MNPYQLKEPTAEELLATINRALPFSDEAEKSVLSSILQDPRGRISECRIDLPPAAFYHEANEAIYQKILEFDSLGLPIDPVMMTNRLRDQNMLDKIGGPAAISELFTFVPSPAHYLYYKKIVQDKYLLRQVIHACSLSIHAAYEHGKQAGDVPAVQVLESAEKRILDVRNAGLRDTRTSASLIQCLDEHVDHMAQLQERRDSGQEVLIKTGFPSIDRICGGIGLSEYWLVTGPTKSGKSVLTGNFAGHAAKNEWKVKIFSNEVNRTAYTGRLIASQTTAFTGIQERKGFETKAEMEAYGKAVTALKRTIARNVEIDNAAGRFVEDICADIRDAASRGYQLFIVDLIGKILTRQPFMNREQQIAYISQQLFNVGKIANVAMVVVSQENDEGQVRESRSLSFDCEAHWQVQHVYPPRQKKSFGATEEPQEYDRTKRNLKCVIARGFGSGDIIPCYFDGPRFKMGELVNEY